MSQSGKEEYKPLQSISTSMPVIALGGQIGCLTLVIVLAAAFGGIWLDKVFDTKPIFTVVLIIGAAPLSLLVTYWMAMQAIRKVNPPQSQETQTEPLKEDETGE